jgi:galactokinase
MIEWSNYFKAGYLGHATYLKNPAMPSMKILINGTVPTGSGLSSSAALVVSSLISSLLSSTTTLSKRKIVELAMISERNVGVNSGGMDQAASVFGEKEKAVFVEFAPELKGTTVKFPEDDVAFVIANTLVNADKHDTAPENYNLRVVETTCSAEILARKSDLGELKSRDGFGGTLQEVVQKYFRGREISMEEQLEEFQKVVQEVFKGEGEYTRSELAEMMGLTEAELVEKYMTRFPGSYFHLYLCIPDLQYERQSLNC